MIVRSFLGGILSFSHPLFTFLDVNVKNTKQLSNKSLSAPNRLLIVTRFYPPDFAATGQLIEELAIYLSCCGVNVRVFTGQPGYAFQSDAAPAQESSNNLLIRRTRISRIWSNRIRGRVVNGVLFWLRSFIHLVKAAFWCKTLLLTTEPPYLPLLGYLINRMTGIPYICLLYDLYPDVAVELNVIKQQHWLVKIWDWLNVQTWKHAQQVIVLSSTMKDRVVAKCPEIGDRVTVIHSWANPRWILPVKKQDNAFAATHNLVDRFTVLYSGNMGRCHDIETIVEAAHLLQEEPIQFVFIGGGPRKQECQDLVVSLGLTNCLFLPYQEKENLPHSLTACDLALVSLLPGMEGLIAPSKLYGMLAAGRPIAAICEPHSYLRQILEEAGCGQAIVNQDSASLVKFIRQLAADPLLARQMGEAGRNYLLANFTLEIIGQQYLQVLHSEQNGKFHHLDLNSHPIHAPGSLHDR